MTNEEPPHDEDTVPGVIEPAEGEDENLPEDDDEVDDDEDEDDDDVAG